MALVGGFVLRAVALAGVALTLLAAPAIAAQQAGALDPSYGNGGRVVLPVGDNAEATAFALQADDRALIGGVAIFGAEERFAIARLTTQGTPDATFGDGGVASAKVGVAVNALFALAVQPDGKIVAAGTADPGSGNTSFAVARFLPDGTLDQSFGDHGTVVTSFVGSAQAVAIQPDGKIILAGDHVQLPSLHFDFGLARLQPNGDLDASFGNGGTVTTPFPTGDSQALGVALDRQGRIVAAGGAGQPGHSVFALARYLDSGGLDSGFGDNGLVTTPLGDGAAAAEALAIQPNGRIVAAGRDASGRFALVRYRPDGSLDGSFGDSGIVGTPIGSAAAAFGLDTRSGARIVAAGSTTTGDQTDFALATYQPAGKLDKHFGQNGIVTTPFPGLSTQIQGVAYTSDGKLVAGGNASDAANHGEFAAARYFGR
jgi:uncharacterized delta-60 repeat protein